MDTPRSLIYPCLMDIRQITPDFYAAPQITPEDLPEIAAAGIRRIICNRPDVEVPPELCASVMSEAANQSGIDFFVRPLTHQNMTPDVISENWGLIDGPDSPVLAYCASGTRSTIAWALGAAKTMPVDDVVAAAAAAGYNLENLRPTLEAVARM